MGRGDPEDCLHLDKVAADWSHMSTTYFLFFFIQKILFVIKKVEKVKEKKADNR